MAPAHGEAMSDTGANFAKIRESANSACRPTGPVRDAVGNWTDRKFSKNSLITKKSDHVFQQFSKVAVRNTAVEKKRGCTNVLILAHPPRAKL